MTENQKNLLLSVAENGGISSADMSSDEMRIAEILADDGLVYFDLTLRLTNAGWGAIERLDACN